MSYFSSPSNEMEEFTAHHVYDIRSFCVCLLDSIAAIIEARHNENPASYQLLATKMFSLDEKIFQGIHQRYLWWASSMPFKPQAKIKLPKKSATGVRGQSGDKTLNLRAIDTFLDKILFSFTSALDSCKTTLLQCLKRRSDREMMLHEQLKLSQSNLSKLSNELSQSKSKLQSASREQEMFFKYAVEAKNQLQDAEEKIKMLETNSLVLAWQSQLDDLNKKHKDEQDKMEEILVSSEESHKQTCDFLQKRITKMQDNIAKLKIKTEFTIVPTTSSLLEKLEHKKRETYLKDQELFFLRKKLNEQHRLMIGCMNGLETDYRKCLTKWNSENLIGRFSPDSEQVKFQAVLRYISESCSNGTLAETQRSLPDQYRPPDKLPPNFKQKRILNRQQNDKNTEKVFKKQLPVETVSKLRSNSLNIASHAPAKPPPDILVVRPHSAETKMTASPTEKPSKPDKSAKLPRHPILVNTITGRANLLQVMKHFPYLTVDQVSKQWEKFKSYDKNRDFRLDLPELYEVVQSVLGIKVSIQEMREAMSEVDRDESNNIDFYEYLKITEMIMKKQGKSALFRNGFASEDGLTSSDACAVQ